MAETDEAIMEETWERVQEEKEVDQYSLHLKFPPTFQLRLRLWLLINKSYCLILYVGLVVSSYVYR